jgi:hypothetical protein
VDREVRMITTDLDFGMATTVKASPPLLVLLTIAEITILYLARSPSASSRLKKLVKTMHPGSGDDVVFHWDIPKRCREGWVEGDRKKVMHCFCETDGLRQNQSDDIERNLTFSAVEDPQ